MSNYIIDVYYQIQNKHRYRMSTKIGNQPTVVYNSLTKEDVLAFINSHNEFVTVNFYLPKRCKDIFPVDKNNISVYNFSLTEFTNS